MKTTLELPDDLIKRAKVTAAQRRTSLKALVEHALRRELGDGGVEKTVRAFRVDEDGLPYVPSRGGRVTSELVQRLIEEE